MHDVEQYMNIIEKVMIMNDVIRKRKCISRVHIYIVYVGA